MRSGLASLLLVLSASVVWAPDASADAAAGKTFFDSIEGGNCKGCHYTTRLRMVGPGLENVTKRHSEEWLLLWLHDPQGTWKGDHPETRELKERTRKAKAPATSCVKKPMDEMQTRDLVDYLKTLETD
jgi:cytochrome c2